MVFFTLLARATDGLPLSSSVQDEDTQDRDLTQYQSRAKAIFRNLSPQSPPKCSIETPPLVFHYVIEENVCCLCLCEPSYPTSLAFDYLKTVSEEFAKQCGHRIFEAQRPYYFIEFGTEIERVKRNFSESRPRSQLSSVAGELQGVQRIMFDNIDAVLKRGEMIDSLTEKTGQLAMHSQKYRQSARQLNLSTSLALKIALAVGIFFFLLFFYLWFF
jgi:vesicle transport protein SEC22